MYPEFIPIYIGLGVSLVLQIALLIVGIVLLRRTNTSSFGISTQVKKAQQANGGEVVFCRKCATQYDSSLHSCPNCGTPR